MTTWGAARVFGIQHVVPLSPAGPIVAALLLRRRDADWRHVTAGGALVCSAAQLVAGTAPGIALGLVVTDVAIGGILAQVLRRLDRDLAPAPALPLVLVALLSAGFAAGALHALVTMPLALDPPRVAAAVGAWLAGLAVFTVPVWAGISPFRRPASLLVIALVAMAAAALAFAQDAHPLAFTLIPLGLGAAWWRRETGAAVATVVVGGVTAVLTFAGTGPIARLYPDPIEQVVAWQLVFLTLALSTHASALLLRDRRRSLDAALRAESQLRLVTDNTTDMISVLAPDLTRLWVSSAAERLLGYTPADLVGRPVPELVNEEDRLAYIAAVRSAFAHGTGSIVYRHRCACGDFVWMEALFRRVEGVPGPELIAVNRDVTARRLAEDAAARAREQASERERLLSMAETLAKVGYWRLEAGSDAVTWSPEIYRLYGIEQTETAPSLTNALAAIHPDDRAGVETMLATSLETGAPYAVTMRILRPDGSVRWARSVAQRDVVDGRVVGLFGVVLDVSEEGEALAAGGGGGGGGARAGRALRLRRDDQP